MTPDSHRKILPCKLHSLKKYKLYFYPTKHMAEMGMPKVLLNFGKPDPNFKVKNYDLSGRWSRKKGPVLIHVKIWPLGLYFCQKISAMHFA